MSAGRPKYRLFESTGFLYPDPFPAFADSEDFDALAAWAVHHNEWKGTRTAALIVSDEGCFWKVHPNGSTVEISDIPGPSGISQVERYAARLARGPSPGDDRYELPPPERWQHKTIHVPLARHLNAMPENHNQREEEDERQEDALRPDAPLQPPAAPSGDGSGTPFGRYRLLELLGRGGMGEVWRAFDPTFKRVVALKVLPPNFADDQDFQERFRREAEKAGGIDEPHVVPVHEFGEIDGRLYVTMQLIKGRDLQAVLEDGPLPPSRAVKIIEQISLALQAAHEMGLVHRDVKPSNILVAKDDFAYLIDFGIARATGETKLSKTGALVGTLAYMAPERFTTGVADARADIYSLACVLHECLTGTQPYPGDSAEQQMTAHLTLDPPRPSSRNPAIPGKFDEVIACGMAKQPAERFSSAGELARAATDAAASSPSPNERGPRQPRSTRRFATRWPNPDGTGDTPYADHLRVSEPAESKPGRGPLVLVAAAMLTFVAAALVAALLIFRENRGSPSDSASPTRNSEMITASPTARSSAAGNQPQSTLPGTDGLGFVGYPAARCDPGNTPAVMGRTTQSLVVICEIGPANYYYRALRLSDGASIELTNAVRSSGGFDVTNPVDRTRYQIRRTGISITSPDGQVSSEPMVEYAAS